MVLPSIGGDATDTTTVPSSTAIPGRDRGRTRTVIRIPSPTSWPSVTRRFMVPTIMAKGDDGNE